MDVDLLRPADWLASAGITVGETIPLRSDELELIGTATVVAIDPCPVLADGPGEVVTGRYFTRQVTQTARVTLANGGQLEGTPSHPVWVPGVQDWVPLGDLVPGDEVLANDQPLAVVAVERVDRTVPVYNLEVRGEHVYQVTAAAVLVHNTAPCELELVPLNGLDGKPINLAPNTNLPIGQRIGRFFDRLKGQAPSSTADDALARIGRTLDEVEDLHSGNPKRTPPPPPGIPDGRMYPPLSDNIVRNADGSIVARTRGHIIEIGKDGSIRIRNARTGNIDFEQPGG